MMERKKIDILCVQESRWKGSKARCTGGRLKLFYHGEEERVKMKSVQQDNEFEAGNRRLDVECCQCAWPTAWLSGRREFGSTGTGMVSGVSSGQRKKETLCKNQEAQESIQRKGLSQK